MKTMFGRQTWEGGIRQDEPLYPRRGRIGHYYFQPAWLSTRRFQRITLVFRTRLIYSCFGGVGKERRFGQRSIPPMLKSWNVFDACRKIVAEPWSDFSLQEHRTIELLWLPRFQTQTGVQQINDTAAKYKRERLWWRRSMASLVFRPPGTYIHILEGTSLILKI